MDIYAEIAAERVAAHAKHGASGRSCEQLSFDSTLWLPILTEEVGEVAKAICDNEPLDALRAELVQVAAMAAAWAESIDRVPR